ncbi:4-Cys prefix domain-containing protein [Trichodesmium erythraeum]
MSYCINPEFPQPKNADTVSNCQGCYFPLVIQGDYRVFKKFG